MSDVSPARCVVVGVDFSEASRAAVALAQEVSARARVPLELIHVWNPRQLVGADDVLPEIAGWLASHRQRLEAQLEDWAAQAREAGVDASSRVVEGVASRVLPELARAPRAGLLVVGRRGSANLAHVLLGSISERVVRLASCPVLVVPEAGAAARAPERMLVGVDFSSASMDAYHAALELARQLDVPRGLLLIHARPGERELDDRSELAYRGEYPYDQRALEGWAAVREPEGVPVEVRVVTGSTEQVLVSAAPGEGCDWLVVGVQGRSALAALLLGSTTDRVLKLAECPVLVVPMSSSPPGEGAG